MNAACAIDEMEDEQRHENPQNSAPHGFTVMAVRRFGQVARDEDEQRHVKNVDEPHERMIQHVAVVQHGDDMAQDDQDDEESL